MLRLNKKNDGGFLIHPGAMDSDLLYTLGEFIDATVFLFAMVDVKKEFGEGEENGKDFACACHQIVAMGRGLA
jgi:hypothetical protein